MDDKQQSLENRREMLRKKSYLLMFEIFIIFGAPAFVAYFVGKFLMERYLLGGYVWIFVLLPAFILGWVIFFFRFRKISNELKEVNKKINKSN